MSEHGHAGLAAGRHQDRGSHHRRSPAHLRGRARGRHLETLQTRVLPRGRENKTMLCFYDLKLVQQID